MLRVFQFARHQCRALAAAALLFVSACDAVDLATLTQGTVLNPDRATPVALLVPRGSGNPSDDVLAQSLENAAKLAISGLEGAQIDLRVYGTAANPATAAAAAKQAVSDGAKIILGPVYGEAANAVGVAMSDTDVNVLAFSNNASIAGGNVFILGPTFGNTADRLVNYAAAQGKRRIVIVHGNDVSGQLGRNAIQQATRGNGAEIVGSVEYPLSQEGVANAVPQITSAVTSASADTVFLTSTPSGALPIYAGMLPAAGVRQPQTQFVGLTRWDIPTQTLSLPGLQGGLFAVPDPERVAGFSTRYLDTFGAAPHPIGGLAFDGIAAIGALIAQGNADALTAAALTQPNGFQGVTGVFRLRPDGTNQRALAVARIQNNRSVIVDPAPQSFTGF